MTVISLSANEKMLTELDRIQRELGFSGRSETIRAAVRMFISEYTEKKDLTGRVRGVLLVIHEHEAEDFITRIKHKFMDIIYTQLHNRFKEGRCLELFILDGEAERIAQLKKVLQKSEQIEHVKLIVA